jgi:hypothetical protein
MSGTGLDADDGVHFPEFSHGLEGGDPAGTRQSGDVGREAVESGANRQPLEHRDILDARVRESRSRA